MRKIGCWVLVLAVAGAAGCAPRAVLPREVLEAPTVAVSAAGAESSERLSRYRELLADSDAGIRIAAAHVLLRYGDLEGKPILLGALHSADVHHRINAALALQGIDDPETVAELQRTAKSERHPLGRIILREMLKRPPGDH